MKFETLEVGGIVPALHGMRNPKNSWHLADTKREPTSPTGISIGPNDMDLAQRLIKGGSVHSKFLRQIVVWVDITAPIYWWSEFDTYKVGVVRDSCSTMHKLLSIVNAVHPNQMKDVVELFDVKEPEEVMAVIEAYRHIYEVATSDRTNKQKKVMMKRMLPDSYQLMSTCSLSYQNIRSMIRWRKAHELDAWAVTFIEWAHTLPYADEFLFYENGGID